MLDRPGCLGSFFVFILIGIGIAIPIYGTLTIGWAISNALQIKSYTAQTSCTVLEKRIDYSPGDETSNDDWVPRFTLLVKISAQKTQHVSNSSIPSQWWGMSEETARSFANRFQIGRDYPCWYDPSDPSRVVLAHDYDFTPAYVAGLFVMLEVIGGTVMWRKSVSGSRHRIRSY